MEDWKKKQESLQLARSSANGNKDFEYNEGDSPDLPL